MPYVNDTDWAKVQQDIAMLKSQVANALNLKGCPDVKGYAGKKMDLNDNFNVVEWSKRLKAVVNVDNTGSVVVLPPISHTQPWSTITSTPTTLAGYGITDAAPKAHGVTTGYVPQAASSTSWVNSILSSYTGGISLAGELYMSGAYNLKYASSAFTLFADTTYGADTKALYLHTGGSLNSGGGVELFGNQNGSFPGDCRLYAGSTAGNLIASMSTGYLSIAAGTSHVEVGRFANIGAINTVVDVLSLTNPIGASCGGNHGNGAALILRACLGSDNNNAPEIAGRIAAIDNGDNGVSNSYLSFQTAAAGVVTEKMRLTSGGLLGLGVTPTAQIDSLAAGASPYLHNRLVGLAHGMVALAETNVFLKIAVADTTYGGANISGYTGSDITALGISAVVGTTTTTHPAFVLLGAKKAPSGPAWQVLAATEVHSRWDNLTNPLMTLYGNGNLSVVGDVYTTAFTTWTPTIGFIGGGGNVAPAYSTRTAYYHRIGQIVHFWLDLEGDGGAEGAGSGILTINTPTGINSVLASIPVGSGHIINGASDQPVIVIANFGSVSMLFPNGAGVTGADQNNTTRFIRISGTYEAA